MIITTRLLALLYFSMCIGYISYAQNKPAVPSHEDQIIMLEIFEDDMYSLDNNGLLLITDVQSLDTQYINIIKTSVESAYFFFPYIVLIDENTRMSVYNLQYKLIAFQDTFHGTNTGNITFSSDLSLFAYNDSTHINIYHTRTWNKITSIENKNAPSVFLIISKNNRNIMRYSSDGTITYYDILSREIIKSIKTDSSLQSLSLNATLRYGIGYTSHTLQSIDVLDGSLVDSVLFSDTLLYVFPATHTHNANDTDAKIFHVVTLQGDGTQVIRMYEFTNNGLLQQKDLQSLSLVKNVTQIKSDKNYSYIGFEDGEVWRYPILQQFTNHEVILDNTTLAIYDVLLVDNTLLLATAEGIASLSLSAENNNLTTSDITLLHTQQLTNPAFISSHTHAPQKPLYYLFTSQIPYNYTLPPILFDTIVNDGNTRIKKTQDSNKITSNFPSLLYSMSDNFQLITPQPLSPTACSLLIYDTTTISYSSHESVLHIGNATQMTHSIPVYSDHFVYKLMSLENKEELVLWTNSPLLDNQRDTQMTENILYKYLLAPDNTLIPTSNYFEIPFNHSVLDFQIIDPASSTLLIATYDKNKTHTYVNLVAFNDQIENFNNDDDTNTIKKLLSPKSITPLTEIVDNTILKIVPLGENKNIILIFTNERVHMITLDDNLRSIISEQKMSFPKEFGLFRNASVSLISSLSDNQITQNTDTYLITMIDKNNTVSLLQADGIRGLSTEVSFQVSKEYEIIEY